MSDSWKTAVISGVAILGVALGAAVLFFVREAVGQRAVNSDEGYFSPVYSPDGQYVYFIERRSNGTVVQTKPADLLFSPPNYDVTVSEDTFILKRKHVANGKVEELRRLPPAPTEGERYQMIGNPFHYAGVRLRFKEDRQLEFRVCLTIHQGGPVREYMSSGMWSGEAGAANTDDSWKSAACMIQGYDEWPLFGDWELQEVRRPGFFPVAIVAFNHVTRDVRVLLENKHYRQLYPNGVPAGETRQGLCQVRRGARPNRAAGL